MSLVSCASPWTNDNTSSQTRKRTSTIRKTVKLRPMNETGLGDKYDDPDAYNSSDSKSSSYHSSEQNYREMKFENIDETEHRNGGHSNRVNEILNKIASENDGNKLANFKPLDNASINTRRKTVEDVNNVEYDNVHSSMPNELLPKTLEKQPASMYSANEFGGPSMSQGPRFSNYNTTYPSTTLFKGNVPKTYFSGSGQIAAHNIESTNGKLMEKINYMIHLLEAQHNEKTANITEEFILYIFLGVFVIFVVDSFTKTGKYVR
jgi:hypothetical protein